MLSAHVAYKHNASFLRALAEQLGVFIAPTREGGLRSGLAWIWSASQALMVPLLVGAVCLLGVAFLAAFSIMAAAMLTSVISAAWYVVHWLVIGTAGSFWFSRVFFWLTAFFLVSMTGLVTLIPTGWGKRAARLSVARWWRVVEPR